MLGEVQQLEGKSCPVQQEIPLYHLPDNGKVYIRLYIIKALFFLYCFFFFFFFLVLCLKKP